MPRTAGVSCNSLVLLMPRRPRPRTVARCDSLVPIGLRTSWTFTLVSLVISMPALAEDFFDRFATLGGNVGSRRGVFQCIHCGPHHVVRVARTVAFGHDVGDAHYFENSAHGSASNDAGTLGSRCHHDVCGLSLIH